MISNSDLMAQGVSNATRISFVWKENYLLLNMLFFFQSLERSLGLILIFTHVGVAVFTGSVLGNSTSARVFNISRPTNTSIHETQNATAAPPYHLSTLMNLSATVGAIQKFPGFFQTTAPSTQSTGPWPNGTLIPNSTSDHTTSLNSSLPTNSSMGTTW